MIMANEVFVTLQPVDNKRFSLIYRPTPWGDKGTQTLTMTTQCIPETILSNFAIRTRWLDVNLSFVMTPNGNEGT